MKAVRKQRQDRVEHDEKRILRIVITACMCVLLLISLFIFIRSFLPVTRFELSGVTNYDKSEIIG